MKRLIALVLACVFCFFGCSGDDELKQSGNKLTLDKVIELSAKGEKLTWSDFEQYDSVATGSGLYILVYEIDENFELMIGGGSLEEFPMYIYLVAKKNNDKRIDIRTDDVKAFIDANKK